MNRLISELRTWYEGLNTRERRLVLAVAIVIGVFIPYQLIWEPFQSSVDDMEERVTAKRKELADVQRMGQEVQQLRAQSGVRARPAGRQPLLTMADSTARRQLAGAVENVKEEGSDGVRVQLKNARFDDVMRWLDGLQTTQGVVVREISVNRQAPGQVSGRVILELP